jgi:S-adenosylhomocysteine hydrolase
MKPIYWFKSNEDMVKDKIKKIFDNLSEMYGLSLEFAELGKIGLNKYSTSDFTAELSEEKNDLCWVGCSVESIRRKHNWRYKWEWNTVSGHILEVIIAMGRDEDEALLTVKIDGDENECFYPTIMSILQL